MSSVNPQIDTEERIAQLLYPLSDFYRRAGVSSPNVNVIDGEAMPQPARSLLVHHNDMTPTLEKYTGRKLHLKPIRVRREGNSLYRQVLLIPDPDEAPVEFGAIRIELGEFPPKAKKLIEDCHIPLGTILYDFSISHKSRPSAFFVVEPDSVMRQALHLQNGLPLHGRHNVITGAHEQLLADVVEILPPMEDRSAA